MQMANPATCRCVSVYEEMLTYSRKYDVLDSTDENVLVVDDAGKNKWYPKYCFDLSGADAPRLVSIHIDDPAPFESPVEVTVHLSDGRRRWCWFATPQMLQESGDWVPGTTVRLHYCCHMIVMSELSEGLIHAALRHLERQGDLVEHSAELEGSH